MVGFKSGFATCLVLLGLCGAGVMACAAGQERRGGVNNAPSPQASAQATAPGQEAARGQGGEMQALAEGSYGEMGPFVAVVRDPKVYAVLRGTLPSLPELSADFFRSNALVAVFIGQRNRGGHAVEFRRESGGRLLVSERMPPADAITTQAITHPFKVVAVPVKESEPVSVLLQGRLASELLRPYRVASGEVASADPGGVERLRLEGTLGLARHGSLLTILFDLKGAGKTAALPVAATGIVEADGRFSVEGVDSRAFVGTTAAPLRVTGRLAGEGDRLQLAFGPRAAGLGVSGNLEVLATGPAPEGGRPDSSIY